MENRFDMYKEIVDLIPNLPYTTAFLKEKNMLHAS